MGGSGHWVTDGLVFKDHRKKSPKMGLEPQEMTLRVSGLSKTFRDGSGSETAALQDIHLEVGEGDFLCIVGPSGSGKDNLSSDPCRSREAILR
jgi:ABC-type protease/lipase transport system fused ATPase/permease subunit